MQEDRKFRVTAEVNQLRLADLLRVANEVGVELSVDSLRPEPPFTMDLVAALAPPSGSGRSHAEGQERASPVGRRRGVVRPVEETRSGLVLLVALSGGGRVGHPALEEALRVAGYNESTRSPVLSKLRRAGLADRDPGAAWLTPAGEDLVLSDEHGRRLKEAGL